MALLLNTDRPPMSLSQGNSMLSSFARAVKTYKYVIIVFLLLGAALGAVWGFAAPESYRAVSKVYINPFFAGDNAAQMARQPTGGSGPIVENYGALALSSSYLTEAKQLAGINQGNEELRRKLAAGPAGKSQFLEIAAEQDSPVKAQRLANSLATVLIGRSGQSRDRQADALIRELSAAYRRDPDNTVIRGRLQQMQTIRVGDNPTVSLAIPASRPAKAVGLAPAYKIVAGAAAGLIVGLLLALIFGGNYRLKSRRQIEKDYRLPVVAELARPDGDLALFGRSQRLAENLGRRCQVVYLTGPASELAARAWASGLRQSGQEVLIVGRSGQTEKLSDFPQSTLVAADGSSWLAGRPKSIDKLLDKAQIYFDTVIVLDEPAPGHLLTVDLSQARKEDVDGELDRNTSGFVLLS